jgi:hypothetical protein
VPAVTTTFILPTVLATLSLIPLVYLALHLLAVHDPHVADLFLGWLRFLVEGHKVCSLEWVLIAPKVAIRHGLRDDGGSQVGANLTYRTYPIKCNPFDKLIGAHRRFPLFNCSPPEEAS